MQFFFSASGLLYPTKEGEEVDLYSQVDGVVLLVEVLWIKHENFRKSIVIIDGSDKTR